MGEGNSGELQWGVIFGKFSDLRFIFINANHSKWGQRVVNGRQLLSLLRSTQMGKTGAGVSFLCVKFVKWLWDTSQSEQHSNNANWVLLEQEL